MPYSNATKQAFADALRKLLEQKPIAKISVSHICEECGMNRKSFYYHFKTNVDLLSYYIEDQPTMGPDLLETPKSLEDVKDGIVRVYLNYVAYCRELGVEFMAGN